MTLPSLRFTSRSSVFALIALLGCGQAERATGVSDGNAILRGTVASARTAVGVPNLVVALVSDGAVVAAEPTDADGRFEFSRVPDGSYTVRVTGLELSELSPRHVVLEPAAMPVSLAGGPVDVLFAAVGVIPPRIVGDITCGGGFVEGAKVRIVGGGTDIVLTTNAQGRYAATDLAPGHYAVIVVEAPCAITPTFRVASVLPAQAAEVDFDG